MSDDPYAVLRRQSLGRPLTDDEQALAEVMERIFRSGAHDFDEVARILEQEHVRRPSGAAGSWTAAVLEQELSAINASLDAAYLANGRGA